MNWDDFIENMIRQSGLHLKVPIIIGVSGGPDSLCLLHCLKTSNLNIIAVHVNHSIRENAEFDADQVRDYCKNNQIPFILGQVNAPEYSTSHKLSLEEAARILRYQFLFEQAKHYQAEAVVVAHNANDQVETILMHLMRGCGLSGLKGMAMRSINPSWSVTIPLVRPLLQTPRSVIERYCSEHHLNPVLDESNKDKTYFRNRIRLELIPYLETYNPQISSSLVKMAGILESDEAYITDSMLRLWKEALLEQENDYLIFSSNALKDCHPALLRRLLRNAFTTLQPDARDLDFLSVEQARYFLTEPSHCNELSWCSEISIYKYLKTKIIFHNNPEVIGDFWPQIRMTNGEGIPLVENCSLNNHWEIRFEYLQGIPAISPDPMICLVDAEKAIDLTLGTIQPGERFKPYGMNGKSLKLGDYWTNRGLPEIARKKWPLIRSKGEIVWVPGFQIAEPYKISESTKRVLSLRIIKK